MFFVTIYDLFVTNAPVHFFSSVMHQKADEKTLKHVADLAPMSEEIKPIFSLKYSHCLQRWSYTCHCF